MGAVQVVGERLKCGRFFGKIFCKKIRFSQKLFACAAACLDTPQELSAQHYTTFPVKLTTPVTPILYITDNMNHLNELKHTIHVQDVVEGTKRIFFKIPLNFFSIPCSSRARTPTNFIAQTRSPTRRIADRILGGARFSDRDIPFVPL